MKKNPIIEPIIVVVLGIAIIIASFTIKTTVTSIKIGPDFMPRLLGIFMVILGLCLIPESIKKQKSIVVSEEKEATKIKKPLTAKEWLFKNLHLVSLAWMLIYALSMQKLGFLFSSIIYLFVAMFLLSLRKEKINWWVIVIISLVVPTFVYILFRQKFYLMLPVGLCKYIPLNFLR